MPRKLTLAAGHLLQQGVGPLLGVLLGAGLVTIVGAQTGTLGNGIIHACINPNSGDIKIVAAIQLCRPNDTPLSWSALGSGGESGVTAGGGLTGRWEGTYTLTGCDEGHASLPMVLVLLQESIGDLTGSAAIVHTGPPAGFTTAEAVIGRVTDQQVSFRWRYREFQGAIQDRNHLSGTFASAPLDPGCGGPWSLQRAPMLP